MVCVWDVDVRDAGGFYCGARLVVAFDWVVDHEFEFNCVERVFFDYSCSVSE